MGNAQTSGQRAGDTAGFSNNRVPTRLARRMSRKPANSRTNGSGTQPPASPASQSPSNLAVTPSPTSRSGSAASPAASPTSTPRSQSTSQQSEPPSPSKSHPQGQQPPVKAPPARTPPAKKQSSGSREDTVISNWKLFNDLENREEHSVLELSLFLDALSKYLPDVDGGSNSSNGGQSPPPDEHPALGKTVSAQVVGQIDIANMYVQAAALDDAAITLPYVQDLLESCRNGLKIPRNVIIRVVNEAMALFKAQLTVVEFSVAPAPHATIVGDLHGQLDDLLLIFRENGLPSESNPYLFNGDFVDRGDRGVEIAILIYLFKILYPKHVLVNRGNHEESSITQVFGFMKECEVKYDRFVFDLFCESFKWLPLATLIDRRVLVLHGGVPREVLSLRELNALERYEYDLTRYRTKPKSRGPDRVKYSRFTTMRDLLWSDPKATKGWEENKRGAGIAYGPDVVQKFMTKNKLALIVRSHECVPRGFDWPFQDKGMLVTLFSASNYCGKANNLGCFMRIPSGTTEKPAFFQYMASAESRDMAISNLDMLFSLILEHQADLLADFQAEDTAGTGVLTVAAWARVMEDVLDLSLDWPALQPLLTALDKEGAVPYVTFLARYNAEGAVPTTATASEGEEPMDAERLKRRSAFNSLYRHRARLEALFRALDRDGNGIITLEELENGIKLLNEHLPAGTRPFSTDGADYMKMMDFSHDNEININEFLEGFRINAKLTVHAKWKRARKKIKALSALGALRQLANVGDDDGDKLEAPTAVDKAFMTVPHADGAPRMTRHGSVQVILPQSAMATSPTDVAVELTGDGIEEVDSEEDEDDDEEKAPAMRR